MYKTTHILPPVFNHPTIPHRRAAVVFTMRFFFSIFVTLALTLAATNAVPTCYEDELSEVAFSAPADGEHAVGEEVVFYDNSDDEPMILDWKSDVVNTHNNARAHYGAGKMTWSDALYPDTLKWAKQCQFKHR